MFLRWVSLRAYTLNACVNKRTILPAPHLFCVLVGISTIQAYPLPAIPIGRMELTPGNALANKLGKVHREVHGGDVDALLNCHLDHCCNAADKCVVAQAAGAPSRYFLSAEI